VHLVSEKNRSNFTVPENYHCGQWNKLYFFIAEKFEGAAILERNMSISKRVISLLPKISQATYELRMLEIPENCGFSKSRKSVQGKTVPIGEKLLNSATEWAQQVPRNLDRFLDVIEGNKSGIRTCVGHGDFVIRQMYRVGSKIGVIDGEHAGLWGPMYYDVAQFYIRLRNDHNAKSQSGEFLKLFQKLLSGSDRKNFWNELKPVLIQRYIGDLWGAKKDERKLDDLESLGAEILNDRILIN
jgi:hypothetical protein